MKRVLLLLVLISQFIYGQEILQRNNASGINYSLTTQYTAVKFTANDNYTVGAVEIQAKFNKLIFNSNQWVYGNIYDDNGNKPGKQIIQGISSKVTAIPSIFGQVNLLTNAILNKNTVYWLVIRLDFASPENSLICNSDTLGQGAISRDGITWTVNKVQLNVVIKGRPYNPPVQGNTEASQATKIISLSGDMTKDNSNNVLKLKRDLYGPYIASGDLLYLQDNSHSIVTGAAFVAEIDSVIRIKLNPRAQGNETAYKFDTKEDVAGNLLEIAKKGITKVKVDSSGTIDAKGFTMGGKNILDSIKSTNDSLTVKFNEYAKKYDVDTAKSNLRNEVNEKFNAADTLNAQKFSIISDSLARNSMDIQTNKQSALDSLYNHIILINAQYDSLKSHNLRLLGLIDSLKKKVSDTDTSGRWQPKGIYTIPGDTLLSLAYLKALMNYKLNYSDTNGFRGFSDNKYMGSASTVTSGALPYFNSTTGKALGASSATLTGTGYYTSDLTVNQSALSNIYASQTAQTLQSNSATGTDYTMGTQYVATKFTATAAHTMGDFQVSIKASALLTNYTSTVTGYIYSDNAGVPGTLLATGQGVRLGSLTTSYQTLSVGTTYTMVNGTTYWLVLKYSGTPTGGNIILNSASNTNYGASSTDGTNWANTNSELKFTIRGLTYRGVQGNSTNNIGVYGNSTNNIGVQGNSTNNIGVYGNSTNNIGVYGNSTNNIGVQGNSTNNFGVYGNSTNNIGVYGNSTNNIGVQGNSTNNIGVQGNSTDNIGVYGASTNNVGVQGRSTDNIGGVFYIRGALTQNNPNSTVLIRRYPSGSYNATGNVLQITDNPTVTGTISGSLISGDIDGVTRLDFNPRVSDGATAVAHILDTKNTLSTSGAKLLSIRNGGTDRLTLSYDGSLRLSSLVGDGANIAVHRKSDDKEVIMFGSYANGMALRSDGQFRWGASEWYSGYDIGLSRNSGGVLEINNGVAGTYRDVLLRNVILSNNIVVLNKASSAYITFATRNTTGSEAVYDLSNVGTLSASSIVTAAQFSLSALNTAPASSSATGTTGEIRIVDGYIYVCVGTNSWKRAALSSW